MTGYELIMNYYYNACAYFTPVPTLMHLTTGEISMSASIRKGEMFLLCL